METYRIMHGERLVATITSGGLCRIVDQDFMPYFLWMEEEEDVDSRVQNITGFYTWCSSRLLSLDRQYLKEILNSIGATQAMTDRDRAMIALSYHCLSLTDIYWVADEKDSCTWAEINLYANHLSDAFVEVSLRGKQMSATNLELAPDLSTGGRFPKAWVRRGDGFYLLKDGGRDAVDREYLASLVCQCFRCPQVIYHRELFEGEPVTSSRIFTDLSVSLASREAFEIYAVNQDIEPVSFIKQLDPFGFYMMNVLDYLTGNTDRHWGNWGLLIDNTVNRPVSLQPLMDFNMAFHAYDQMDGGICLTEPSRRMTQREAAVEGVKKVGWDQIAEIRPEWFTEHKDWYEMLKKRMDFLRGQV